VLDWFCRIVTGWMILHALGAVLAWFRPLWWKGDLRQTWDMEVRDMQSTAPGWGLRRPRRLRFVVSVFWHEVFFSRVKNGLRRRLAR
jgi:hypothetical protein